MIKFEQEVSGEYRIWYRLNQTLILQKYAEACGGIGYRVENLDELLPAFESAVKQSRPCIIDVVVDANEAPMPAKSHLVKQLVIRSISDKRII
ncbi:thiamine pyrophosphate-dependent enzyme [Bacillus pacificus]